MLKKRLSVVLICILFIIGLVFFTPNNKTNEVLDIISPTQLVLDNGIFHFDDIESFDPYYSEHNKSLALKNKISEEDAFVIGNLGKYWSKNIIQGRSVYIKEENDLIYYKSSYRIKFLYSGYAFINSQPVYKEGFEKILNEVKRGKYKVLDLDEEKIYELNDKRVRDLDNYIVIRQSHVNRFFKYQTRNKKLDLNDIKIYLTDSTTTLKPNKSCTTLICREILNNINKAEKSIDIAIYGYSDVPEIRKSLEKALARGVKIRLVVDSDAKNNNIYPDTYKLTSLIKSNKNDSTSKEAKNIMHNKFYIFDEKVLITGSANLSRTDMSGFNSNSIAVIKSPQLAKIYQEEFEQMYQGKFHSDKKMINKNKVILSNTEINAYFSPQDKSINNVILPLIKNAREYIYIPTFVLTEKQVTEELIKAKNRGVDVRIIIDALNASIKHSKHNELRHGGLWVKTENYAGKMHSKSMIVDDKYTIIGSMNFSNSGENKNDENLILIKNPEIAKFYKDFFLYQWDRIDNRWLKSNVRAESKDSIGSCYDGLDNNYDGLIDKDDLACKEMLQK